MHIAVCRVCIVAGLEYKLMVKSVDPDETTSVTEKKRNELDKEALSLNRDLQEGGEEEHGDKVGEATTPAAPILEEMGIRPNSTGDDH